MLYGKNKKATTAVVVKAEGKRRELGQVAPNAWRHVRADGIVVVISVPGREG